MKTPDTKTSLKTWYECPVCGNVLPHEPWLARFDAPCSECGYPLWCRRRLPSTETMLEVLPERTPEPRDVQKLVASLITQNLAALVTIDLSQLQIVDSAFVARLISMNRSIHEAGGRFVLRGMCPSIREIFAQLHLDQAFEIVEDEQAVCDTHRAAAVGN
jgi:anti-anti-sigma regulatory factor